MDFYVLQADHTAAGPYSAPEMMQFHHQRVISDETPAAAAGDSAWRPLSDLLPLLRYEAGESPPLPPAPAVDIEAQIAAARQSGPPTPLVLARLLREDEPFPRPRAKLRPPPPLILNPAVRRISLPRPG